MAIKKKVILELLHFMFNNILTWLLSLLNLFNYYNLFNYSFRVVIIAGITIDAAVVAVVEVVGVITADGLMVDFTAKLFRAILSFLQ